MLQAELQTVTGALAALDDDLDMIQQQLEHQMQAQDQGRDDARLVTQLTVHALYFGCLKLVKPFFFHLVLWAHCAGILHRLQLHSSSSWCCLQPATLTAASVTMSIKVWHEYDHSCRFCCSGSLLGSSLMFMRYAAISHARGVQAAAGRFG